MTSVSKAVNLHLFSRTAEEIVETALDFSPRKVFAGYSGGNDSLAAVHWMMNNVPGCEVVHINTGIGSKITRQHVRDVCRNYQWKLTEIRAKEDCGQDYREIVLKYGFPGPAQHIKMYIQLKERCVRELVRRNKEKHRDKIMLATGIRYDESVIRMGYAGGEIQFSGALMWVNPIYWWSASERDEYIKKHNLPKNPISPIIGMSGECACGAYSHKGELALWRIADPDLADEIELLQAEVRAAGHEWGWEEGPPKSKKVIKADPNQMLMCLGCEKRANFKEPKP